MQSTQNNMPVEFKKAIEAARAIKGEDFFMKGGCGVFAILLAEIAQAKGESGTIHMIHHRLGDDSYIMHVCFNHDQSGDIYDIRGGNASSSLTSPIIERERKEMELEGRSEDYIEDQLPTFETDEIRFPSDKTLYEMLIKMTDFFKLRVTSQWIRENYADLRNQVFEAAGLQEPQRMAS